MLSYCRSCAKPLGGDVHVERAIGVQEYRAEALTGVIPKGNGRHLSVVYVKHSLSNGDHNKVPWPATRVRPGQLLLLVWKTVCHMDFGYLAVFTAWRLFPQLWVPVLVAVLGGQAGWGEPASQGHRFAELPVLGFGGGGGNRVIRGEEQGVAFCQFA